MKVYSTNDNPLTYSVERKHHDNDALWEAMRKDLLPCKCMVCGAIYKKVPAGRDVKPGEFSSGYCPYCLPEVEKKWFGGKV